MVGWLCLTSHRQRGHLETAPPFIVPCEGLMISNQKPNSMSKLRYHSLLDTPSNFLRDLTKMKIINLVGWLCLTSHRQRGHLETAPPFTVPCEGREAR